MDRFELLKARTIQFSIEMDKRRLDEYLVIEIMENVNVLEKSPILTSEINTKNDLKKLKKFIDINKKYLNGSLYQDCLEEYREIKDDLKFRSTKSGKLILELEKWVQKTRNLLRTEFKEIRVFIGRSMMDPKELIIGGIYAKKEDVTKIKNFINQHDPPVSPIYKFEIKK